LYIITILFILLVKSCFFDYNDDIIGYLASGGIFDMIYCTARGTNSGSEAVYALLEYALLREHGLPLPKICKTTHGKPYFPSFPDLHFSLSHTKTHVLCAVSTIPIGCDIESQRQISDRALKFFCSASELSLFDPLELWVLKESYIKLLGLTIASIRNLHLSRDGDRIVVDSEKDGLFSFIPDGKQKNSPPVFQKFKIAGCVAAVCTFGENPTDSVELI